MKCEAIYVNSPIYSVRKMCRALGLKEAAYYNWRRAEARRRQRIKNEERDIREVQEAFKDSNCTYGCRRIREALQKTGKEMSEWKIRRIMRENGLYPVQLKKFRPGKQERSDGKYCENIVKQQFKPGKMNEIWAGDITYLKTKLGWVYLAIVMDLFNREVIGYAVDKKMNAELACRALMNAVARNGKPESLVFHSDRGSQYSSRMYQQLLEEYGIKGSMSKPGYPYDNSCVESFFASMKKEYILRKEYDEMSALSRNIFYYVEIFYNRKRLHSTLGYMSPVAYRLQHQQANIA